MALPVGNLSASSQRGAFPAAPGDAALTPASPGKGDPLHLVPTMAASPGGIPAELQGKHRPPAALPGHRCHMESTGTGPPRPWFAVPVVAEPLSGSSWAGAVVQGGAEQDLGCEGFPRPQNLACLRMLLGPKASPENRLHPHGYGSPAGAAQSHGLGVSLAS